MRFIVAFVVAFYVYGYPFAGAFAKTKVQVPSTDPTWVCANTTTSGPCLFHLAEAKDEDIIRVTYPAVGKEIRFKLEGVRPRQIIKIEFVPEQGAGNSFIMMTRGEKPRLLNKETGLALDAPTKDRSRRTWLGFMAVVFFGRTYDTANFTPTFQSNDRGKYFGRFQVLPDDRNFTGSFEVVVKSEEYQPSP